MTLDFARAQRLARYGGRAPRYTSYPTANHFRAMDAAPVLEALAARDGPLAVYAHIPFCTNLCWYCGCNTTIRKNRSIGTRFVDDLLTEAARVSAISGKAGLRHLALGGGTPNFLETSELHRLVDGLVACFGADAERVFSTELDPRTVDDDQLDALLQLGFTRLSLGVQSLDPIVQQVVNRPLPPARLVAVAARARANGPISLNLDLMVGLPRQTPATMDATLVTVDKVAPERLAVFQYAHMPNLRPAQKLLAQHGLPGLEERDALFVHVTERLQQLGYVRVGFDHFALPSDAITIAASEGRLHRNFQGFTEAPDIDLVGLGPSAIGRIGDRFYQNHRGVDEWRAVLEDGGLPVTRGLLRTEEDVVIAALIEDLMCGRPVEVSRVGAMAEDVRSRLGPLAADGLVDVTDDVVRVTRDGQDFVRAIAAAFDAHLDRSAHSVVA